MRTILAIPADFHSGGSTALLPKSWVHLDGSTRRPSESQIVIREQWIEGWHHIRSLNNKKTRLVIVSAGDSIEGVHHGTTQVVTTDIEEQKRMHIACMLEAMKIAKWNDDTDKLYYMMGTHSHVGVTEDAIARDFTNPKTGKHLVDPVIEPTPGGEYQDGKYIREHLQIDINGVLFDIAHSGLSVGTRAWTKNNTANATAKSIYLEALENSARIPRYVVAAHKHQHISGRHDGRHGTIETIITPSLQLKTHYGHTVARFKMADIGLLFFVIEENGDSYWDCKMAQHPDMEVEVL